MPSLKAMLKAWNVVTKAADPRLDALDEAAMLFAPGGSASPDGKTGPRTLAESGLATNVVRRLGAVSPGSRHRRGTHRQICDIHAGRVRPKELQRWSSGGRCEAGSYRPARVRGRQYPNACPIGACKS